MEKLGTLQGDDAHFICAEKKTVGVADGVGGWSKHGIDAGEYARQLMSNAEYAVVNGEPNSKVDPRKVLDAAYSKTKVKGSSTVHSMHFNTRSRRSTLFIPLNLINS